MGGTSMECFRDLPKVNLHQHLEGAVRPETFLQLVKEYQVDLPIDTVEESRQYLQVSGTESSLADFLDKIHRIFAVSRFPGVLKRFAYEAVEDAYRQNVQYLEIRFGPWQHLENNQGVHEPIEQVLAGIQAAKHKYPIDARLIVCALRNDSDPTKNMDLVEVAAAYQNQGVVGFDIAGDEARYPASNFKEIFAKAKKHGLGITVHAGEVGPGQSVIDAIVELSADRIGHGIQIAADFKLVAQVKQAGVTLEVCPTSNVHTKAVSSYASHPIRTLFEQGIPISLGDDDPTTSGINISSEYQVLKEKFDFNSQEVCQIVLNGARAAFLPDNEKQQLISRLELDLKKWQARVDF